VCCFSRRRIDDGIQVTSTAFWLPVAVLISETLAAIMKCRGSEMTKQVTECI
jgi:hypothetical protein